MLQEFYKHIDKIIHLETAREVVHTGKSTSVEAPHKTTQAGKSTSAKKNGENKKRNSRDRRRSLDANKAKSPD